MGSRLSGEAIAVTGLDELRKELRKLDDRGLTDGLKDANYDAASLAVTAARSRASGRLEVAAARTLTPSRAAARAQVTGGGAKAPFFGGAEFGADQNRARVGPSGRQFVGYRQFTPWTGSGSGAGHFLYPAIRDRIAEIVDLYGEALDKLTARAFPD